MGKHLIIITYFASLVLTGCVYKIDIQQGNIVSQSQVDQLKPGMNPDQVRYVMGTPLLMDPFHPNRWDYVYSFQKGGKAMELQHLTLLFRDQQLAGLQGDFHPQPKPGLETPDIVTVDVPPRKIERGIFQIIGDFFRWMFG
ncbi:MAG: hypothetical protein AXA67_08440 [Methylothermaceae bacteria B42]|nr:MAG: hypothetical protein AXA67_08440 [Methylothermaceae bacteria B42]HHJ39716.1 outer membrane protein assembly factor BamE [Methylothermaceae bacterium]